MATIIEVDAETAAASILIVVLIFFAVFVSIWPIGRW
jgi:hypothetical protein